MSEIEFKGFPKLARLSRECIITEKIDGTNASIFIGEGGEFLVGSRTRWITPEDDNYGFAAWAHEHRDELFNGLGVGHHFGEWWGRGINRNYGLTERRFSLFNVVRWCLHGKEPKLMPNANPKAEARYQDVLPGCCGLVPNLWRGVFDTRVVQERLEDLDENGSFAAPGFMKPEGIVVFHTGNGTCFKKTIEKDDQPKGKS